MAKKFLVLKTTVVKKLIIFSWVVFFYQYYNFENTPVTSFEEDKFREESLTYKQHFTHSVFSDFCITCMFHGTHSYICS